MDLDRAGPRRFPHARVILGGAAKLNWKRGPEQS